MLLPVMFRRLPSYGVCCSTPLCCALIGEITSVVLVRAMPEWPVDTIPGWVGGNWILRPQKRLCT